MTLDVLVLATLATYRMTLLISSEEGPFDVLGRFRSWAGIRYGEHSEPIPTNELSKGLLCPYCLSLWLGVAITAFYALTWVFIPLNVFMLVLLPFALSGGVVLMKRWLG